jgi:hypothetical protein
MPPAPFPPPLRFLERWSRGNPQVVYVVSHSNLLGDLDGRPIEGLGDYLLSADAFSAIQADRPDYHRPATPAVLVTTGCATGAPDNALLEVLFAKGWLVGFIGSTETNGPLPFVAAVRSEVHMGDVLSRGMPLGPALRAVEWTYYADSLGPLSWIEQSAARDATEAMIATNLVSYVIYGDPSLRCGRAP